MGDHYNEMSLKRPDHYGVMDMGWGVFDTRAWLIEGLDLDIDVNLRFGITPGGQQQANSISLEEANEVLMAARTQEVYEREYERHIISGVPFAPETILARELQKLR